MDSPGRGDLLVPRRPLMLGRDAPRKLAERPVDYDYVVHHADAEPGLLVITGVPARVCTLCDDYWFDDTVGFELSRLLQESEPSPGEVRTIGWVEAHAA